MKIDLIISDIDMPMMTGYQFFKTVQKKWPDLADKFIFISGSTDSLLAKKIKDLGVVCPTPITFEVLKDILKNKGV